MDESQPIDKLSTELSQSSTPIQPALDQVAQAIKRKPRTHDKKVHGKRYTIAQKLAIKALQNVGLSAHQAQPIAGADRSTIMRIWEDKELDDLSPAVVNKVKNGLSGLF